MLHSCKFMTGVVFLLCGITSAYSAAPTGISFALQSDAQGFMWTGAMEGLHRFDGYEWKLYDHQSSPVKLPEAWVESLCAPADGTLYVGFHQSGIVHMTSDSLLEHALDGSRVNAIACTDDLVVVGTQDGFFWRRGQGVWQGPFLKSIRFTALALHGERVYASTATGLINFGLTNPEKTLLKLADGYFKTLWLEYPILWAGHNTGMARYELTHKRLQTVLTTEERVRVITPNKQSDHQRLWIATEQGKIILFDKQTLQPVKHRYQRRYRNRIHALVETAPDMLVTATDTGIEFVQARMYEAYSIPGKENSWEPIIGTSDDQHRLYLAEINYGIRIWNTQNKQWQTLEWIPESIRKERPYALNWIQDKLWLSTNQALHVIDVENKQVKTYLSKGEGGILSDGSVLQITETLGGKILVGTDAGGLNILDPQQGKSLVIRKATHGLASDEVLLARELSDGAIWIATAVGYSIYDPMTQKVRNFILPDGFRAKVTGFAEYAGVVWVSSFGAGVLAVDLKQPDKQHHHITRLQGLPNNNVLQIKWNALRKQMCLLMRNSVVFLDVNSRSISRLPVNELGTQPSYFEGAIVNTNDGRWFLMSTTEVWELFMEDLKASELFSPPLVVSEVRSASVTPVLRRKEGGELSLEIPAGTDSVDVWLGSVDARASERQMYRYRVEGGGVDWQTLGAQRVFKLSGLVPGQTAIQVQTTRVGGEWGEVSQALQISVAAAWWQDRAIQSWLVVSFLMLSALWLWGWRWLKRNEFWVWNGVRLQQWDQCAREVSRTLRRHLSPQQAAYDARGERNSPWLDPLVELGSMMIRWQQKPLEDEGGLSGILSWNASILRQEYGVHTVIYTAKEGTLSLSQKELMSQVFRYVVSQEKSGTHVDVYLRVETPRWKLLGAPRACMEFKGLQTMAWRKRWALRALVRPYGGTVEWIMKERETPSGEKIKERWLSCSMVYDADVKDADYLVNVDKGPSKSAEVSASSKPDLRVVKGGMFDKPPGLS